MLPPVRGGGPQSGLREHYQWRTGKKLRGYLEGAVVYGQALLYCGPCRARHKERSTPGKEDLPRCEKENYCEVIQGEPYRLDPDNWLPLIIYQRAQELSTSEVIEIHGKKYNSTKTRRTVNPEALRLVIDIYREAIERYGIDRLLDGIAIIQSVYNDCFLDWANRSLAS